jgi:predicted metal-dependent HD superfamily phosphohydrolase
MIDDKRFIGKNATALSDIAKGFYETLERKYHDIEHLYKVTYRVNKLSEQEGLNNKQYTSLIIAAMFHDAVYTPGSKNNEVKSAAITTNILLATNNLDLDFGVITSLILFTIYDRPARNLLEKILHDADWEGFGQRWSVYEKHSRDIRAEYPNVSDEQFRAGRKQFLESVQFPLFYLDGQEELENNAMSNVQRELETLA